jgi:hypothetical protein
VQIARSNPGFKYPTQESVTAVRFCVRGRNDYTGTLTLALPKEGLRAPGVDRQVGELYLADISVPPSLYAEPALGLNVGYLFAESDIIRLR